MSTPRFEASLTNYLSQAKQARDDDQHHDYRRQLFLAFLHDAFGIEQVDVVVEQYIQIANQQVPMKGTARIRKGWIDAVFKDLIFEFKRDYKREETEGLRELRDYLSTIPNGNECVGLLTDGLLFTAYVLDTDHPYELRKIDSINLETATLQGAYLWLDAYLLRQSNLPPTSADIVRRFGLVSPTFVAVARGLREALRVFGESEAGALEVKRQQWAFQLARVYGSADMSNDEMFVRHTYLCQFAKILAYAARVGVSEAIDQVEGIIDGSAFEVLGMGNIGEQDFFSWVLAREVRVQCLGVFQHIAGSLFAYDLSRINEDLLKQLYQNLVEPETRHELGEFYTPDWLAELTLREIGYQRGQSLLDPACGSGTFLFTAIRLLVEQGLTGQALVDFALDNVMGMDVHPLAVTIAKINYMLALLPHFQSIGSTRRAQRVIPIVMANALQVPSKPQRIEVIEVPVNGGRNFQIPMEAARHPKELTEVLNAMRLFALRMARTPNEARFAEFGTFAVGKLSSAHNAQESENERLVWNMNVRLLTRQITEGRDSIWVYVLENTTRPFSLWHRKFDVVVGNPPWIAYRYLQDQTYQSEVKKLMHEYDLLAARDMKLNTQMELATLFFEHCRQVYRKPDGMIAFVLPRSVITGAKQHYAFQQRGFSRILDFKAVEPLFNVETCVLIRQNDDASIEVIPTTCFSGKLPAQECTLAEANSVLTRTEHTTDFVGQGEIASPYYYSRMKNGATLYPRTLAFVTSAQHGIVSGQFAHASIMRTDPDVDDEAKVPWKGLKIQGHIDDEFLYATLLSRCLVPFGVRRFHLVALPLKVGIPTQATTLPNQVQVERFIPMSMEEIEDTIVLARSIDAWFEPVEKLWQTYKKTGTQHTLFQWFNYQNKIVNQSATPEYLVVYGAAGSNIAAAMVDTHKLPGMNVNGVQPRAFIADHTTYWYRSDTEEEAYFLTALLNAPCVDAAIKVYQTRGLFGERHIHRRPFEVCAIPQFDPHNAEHQQLAALSQAAHEVVAGLNLANGGVVAARKRAREAVGGLIRDVDSVARDVLGLR